MAASSILKTVFMAYSPWNTLASDALTALVESCTAGGALAVLVSASLLWVLAQALNKAKAAKVANTEYVFFMLTVLLSGCFNVENSSK